MPYSPLFVGPLSDGLRKDLQPFMLPDEAYPVMENAYQFRGSVYKKGGNQLFGRLGIHNETLAVRGPGATVINLNLPYVPIEPGNLVITDGVTTFTDNGLRDFTVNPVGNGVVNVLTNYATGAINITFSVANPGASILAVYIVAPNARSPVMGLKTLDLENSISTVLMAFDTQFSYRYDPGATSFTHLPFYRTVANRIEWTGGDSNFFQTTNYQNAFFATNGVQGGHFYAIAGITNAAQAVITIGAHNFQINDVVLISNVAGMVNINGLTGTVTNIAAATITVNINSALYPAYVGGGVVHSPYRSKVASGDGLRWYDNTAGASGWVNFTPTLDRDPVPNILQGCLLMIPYHDMLVCLNTIEGTTFATGRRFTNRARYSQNGSCFQASIRPPVAGPVSVDTAQWYASSSRGGFVDAPTNEDIVGAEVIKDTLVVFFERSTWALTYNGNPVLPFKWQRINSDRGSESTFSTVNFDSSIFAVSEESIFSCNSVGSERIDLKVPDEAIGFNNGNFGNRRVHGIRDYYNEFVYWTYVSSLSQSIFPNRVLAYNYRDDTWSIFKDYYTTFGRFAAQRNLAWIDMIRPWAEYIIPWGWQILQAGAPLIIGGNSQGFVHGLKSISRADLPYLNDNQVFAIQNVTAANPSVVTCTNHSFQDGDFVKITGTNGVPAAFNNTIYKIRNVLVNSFTLEDSLGLPVTVAGYTFGGNVSPVDKMLVRTKKFNPTLSFGKKTRVGYIDLFLEDSDNVNSAFFLRVLADEDESVPVLLTEVNTHDFQNINNEKLWRRVFLNITCQSFTVELTHSNQQMFDVQNGIKESPLVLYSFIAWTAPAGRLV